VTNSSKFWDALAPHHGAIENHYLDLPSIRAIIGSLQEPVLVVGAGQGLIVAELRKRGLRCDGVDFSSEMIEYAKLRRGLVLVKADARALPFGASSYRTIIYATGVVDFTSDEETIRLILSEGRRIVNSSGKILVAFYSLSSVLEDFLARVGFLKNNILSHKGSLEMYLLNPAQMLAWVANRAGVGYVRAAALLLRCALFCTMPERAMTFRMQRLFRDPETAKALIGAAPQEQPYRNELAIRNLFQRLAIPIKQLETLVSCWVVQI